MCARTLAGHVRSETGGYRSSQAPSHGAHRYPRAGEVSAWRSNG
ncbi:MAG: hypothetical protein QOD69_1846 [Solirubrobacteraceae bacterium]|jgi:hypothetical protein|nr:hypothetical protein [Solirubrobacteraceae bacterium]